jgi:glycosyltransferase involved in cell wall biosynthesis
MKKRWLVISHAFNMDGRAASSTVTDKIPYLLENEIELIIISAVTGLKDTRLEHYQLLPWGPSGLRFDFRHWFANKYGRGIRYKFSTALVSIALAPFIFLERIFLGLSSQSSWALPAFFKAYKLIKQNRVDLVYTAASAWSAHLVGYWLKRVTGITWIAEVHDPMIIRTSEDSDGFEPQKNRDKRFIQQLEGKICSYADLVWWFTDGALHYAKKRQPQLGDKGFVVCTGAEPPGRFEPLPSFHVYDDILNIAHFGSLANDRSLCTVLQAMNALTKHHPNSRNKIKIHVYGASLDDLSKSAIKELALESMVVLHGRIESDPTTGKTGRERVMEIMRKSDVLLGIQGDTPWCAEYIPSKFYEYFYTNRPIWGVSHLNQQLDDLLHERNAYVSHASDQKSIYFALELIWNDWLSGKLRIAPYLPISTESSVRTILDRVGALEG